MKLFMKNCLLIFIFLLSFTVSGQDIFRFERMGSEDGLSQNTAFSILFDSKGFMWIGTMNGLNRYDGYEFKIYRSSNENGTNFTNNRVTDLWEDKRGFIWLETYDGYYHFFNPESEKFTSLPDYAADKVVNGEMKFFVQYSEDIIFLGSSSSGLFRLKYDSLARSYKIDHYSDLTDPYFPVHNIRFVHKDLTGNLLIGTMSGIFLIHQSNINHEKLTFVRKHEDVIFTSVCETNKEIWLGTYNQGIIVYDKKSGTTGRIIRSSLTGLISDNITHLYRSGSDIIIAGFEGEGIMISDTLGIFWNKIPFHSRDLESLYEDQNGNIWLTAKEFGATRLDPKTHKSTYYNLTPEDIRPLTDLERPQFFEDRSGNLWLGLHGSGLAIYNSTDDIFNFYRHNPKDPNSISSNFVHCISEDLSGQLWIGTGQVLGGIEKIITKNSAFEHRMMLNDGSDILDNVARALLEDKNKFLWVATKAGRLHVFDSTMKQTEVFLSLPGLESRSYRNISYSLFIDKKGYLWIGSKGFGLSVTTKPIDRKEKNYKNVKFRRFEYSESDSSSLGNNNIYSICQDRFNNIWVGTYGNGLNLIRDPYVRDPTFIRINQQNSNLSSNQVRNIIVDSSGNLWVATTIGLNLLERKDIEKEEYRFKVFLHNSADNKSLIYNDIIHIYEDSRKRIWFGTFGGGADMTEKYDGSEPAFVHFGSEALPGFGIIFGILEDSYGKIWLSSENGLIRLDPEDRSLEIFNTFSGLGFSNYSENTCFKRQDGSLIFGGNLGMEIVRPEKIVTSPPIKRIELTKFLLFNKEVATYQKDSPLRKSISYSDEITLKYTQSSFGIDYSGLDFLDPGLVEYSYMLDNFERDWNNVGNQHRATYTNLPPGKYKFRVKSVQPNGISNSDERLLNITILPPWWKTSPAYLSYFIIMSLIIFSVYNALTRINRYKNQLAVEKKVNELKLQFFTNISHEIRTPLTLIIGPLEDMLAQSEINNRKRIQMEIMLKNARRMLHLTNQLLDFRKIQNNKMTLKIYKLDIISFTKEILNSFMPLANHKGITCTFESPFESFQIYADPNKLDTVIYNLISNAIKFTATGKSVRLIIDDSTNSDCININVIDEGPGIPQKNLSELFIRYTILSNAELAGTGIGLALSSELVKLHGGQIIVNSTVGKGSVFTVRLKKGREHFMINGDIEFEIADNNIKINHSSLGGDYYDDDGKQISDASDKKMILVIEDNHEILDYICQSLKSFFICIGARNGREGLHLAKTVNPDVIITDIMMPEMDGIEMTRLLKEDFNTSHIPVIILTSKSAITDQIEGVETGAEAYIMKPFNMEYLKSVASNLINQRMKAAAKYISGNSRIIELPKVNSKDEEFLKRIVSFIEENYSKDFPIDEMASYCKVSRTVLYNKLKGLTSESPIEFVRKTKLNIACGLLDKGYNVSEAAFKTGFSDVKYFSRLYKIQFGYPPSRRKSGIS